MSTGVAGGRRERRGVSLNEEEASKPQVGLLRLARVFGGMGATGFGTSMLPYYRSRLVEDLRWISEDEFLNALKIGQAMPGLNATNLSVIIGDKLAGRAGAVVATLALLLPGALCLCLMGGVFMAHRNDPGLDRTLDGVAAAAAGILLATSWKLGKKQLMSRQVVLVLATAIAAGYYQLSLPVVLLIMLPLSIWACRPGGPAHLEGKP